MHPAEAVGGGVAAADIKAEEEEEMVVEVCVTLAGTTFIAGVMVDAGIKDLHVEIRSLAIKILLLLRVRWAAVQRIVLLET